MHEVGTKHCKCEIHFYIHSILHFLFFKLCCWIVETWIRGLSMVTWIFQIAGRSAGGIGDFTEGGGFFTGWREPKEWFWQFKPFSKLKTAFCECWTSITIKLNRGRVLEGGGGDFSRWGEKEQIFWLVGGVGLPPFPPVGETLLINILTSLGLNYLILAWGVTLRRSLLKGTRGVEDIVTRKLRTKSFLNILPLYI